MPPRWLGLTRSRLCVRVCAVPNKKWIISSGGSLLPDGGGGGPARSSSSSSVLFTLWTRLLALKKEEKEVIRVVQVREGERNSYLSPPSCDAFETICFCRDFKGADKWFSLRMDRIILCKRRVGLSFNSQEKKPSLSLRYIRLCEN